MDDTHTGHFGHWKTDDSHTGKNGRYERELRFNTHTGHLDAMKDKWLAYRQKWPLWETYGLTLIPAIWTLWKTNESHTGQNGHYERLTDDTHTGYFGSYERQMTLIPAQMAIMRDLRMTLIPTILDAMKDRWLSYRPNGPLWETAGVRDSQFEKEGFLCFSVLIPAGRYEN